MLNPICGFNGPSVSEWNRPLILFVGLMVNLSLNGIDVELYFWV